MGARKLVEDSRGDLMKSGIETITPKQAKAWLNGHQNIRPINQRTVASLAHDITQGNWKVTHQGICFNEKDELVDGQHRLHAIVEADRPVRMMVSTIRGITAQDPIDEGRRRSLSLLSGHRTRTISALGVLRYFEAGEMIHRPLTLAEANDVYDHHKGAFEMLGMVPKIHSLTGGTLAALVWAWPCDAEKVRGFAVELTLGEMIKRGDPSFAFRNWMVATRHSHPEEVALAACNCVRAYLAGQKLTSVFAGETGYRALVAQRRKHRIPFTPTVQAVEGVSLSRGRTE